MLMNVLFTILLIVFGLVSPTYAQVPVEEGLPEIIERYMQAEESGGQLVDIRSAWEALSREPGLVQFAKDNYPHIYSRFKLRSLKYRSEAIREEYDALLDYEGTASRTTLRDELIDNMTTTEERLQDVDRVYNNRQAVFERANQDREPNFVTADESNRVQVLSNPNKVTYSNSDRARQSPNRVTRTNNEIINDAVRRATPDP